MTTRLHIPHPGYIEDLLMTSQWRSGSAVLIGETNGHKVEATDTVEFKYKLVMEDGDVKLEIDRFVEIGPVKTSVIAPTILIFDTEDGDDEPLGWLQPPPGAGMLGGSVCLEPGKALNG